MDKQKNDWKSLVQGFVVNMLEHVSDNISHKVGVWFSKLKRKTAGAALMVLGVTFVLTGIAVYANTVLEKVLPGIGYAIVGLVILVAGYFISKDK